MTYIVGIEIEPGLTTIICDTMTGTRDNRYDTVKSGLMFPGCIFGIAGNSREADEFIIGFKNLKRPPEKTLAADAEHPYCIFCGFVYTGHTEVCTFACREWASKLVTRDGMTEAGRKRCGQRSGTPTTTRASL